MTESPKSSSSDDELSDESTSTSLSEREKASHVEASHEKVAADLCEEAGDEDIKEKLPDGRLWAHAKEARGTLALPPTTTSSFATMPGSFAASALMCAWVRGH